LLTVPIGGGKVYFHGWEGMGKCSHVTRRLRALANKCKKDIVDQKYTPFERKSTRVGGVAFLDNIPLTYTWISVALP
jgi:hypothetical protein